MGNTIKLHRVFTAPAERIYRAFLDSAANAKFSAAEWVYVQSL
jgi:uncharacterized protein YndB with AHSA1/START domain